MFLFPIQLPDAQYYVGLCYENGLGVERNKKVAAEFFNKAAKQGNKRAVEKLQNNIKQLDGEFLLVQFSLANYFAVIILFCNIFRY